MSSLLYQYRCLHEFRLFVQYMMLSVIAAQFLSRDYCVFAFEPNPKFEKRHLDLQAAYEKMGWHYVPILAGASDKDGNFTFYHSHEGETETGFSAVTPKTLYGTEAEKQTVKIVRLAEWIRSNIEGREIPSNPHRSSNSSDASQLEEPKVILKLDIEGLEFKVFPDLAVTGALCNNIHVLLGEFHYGPGNHNYYPINLTSDGRHVLHHRKEGQQLAGELLHFVDIAENCMTRISLDDDESYKTDPHPFPTPANETSAAVR